MSQIKEATPTTLLHPSHHIMTGEEQEVVEEEKEEDGGEEQWIQLKLLDGRCKNSSLHQN
jgi:hypothetical protein